MKSKYFKIVELISPEILSVLSEEAAWRLIPGDVIYGLDNLRALYGNPIWINGNGLTQCGVRALNCATGAKMSGHKLYRGETCFDLHGKDLGKLEQIVRENHYKLGIGRMENPDITIPGGWLHISFIKGAVDLEVFDP